MLGVVWPKARRDLDLDLSSKWVDQHLQLLAVLVWRGSMDIFNLARPLAALGLCLCLCLCLSIDICPLLNSQNGLASAPRPGAFGGGVSVRNGARHGRSTTAAREHRAPLGRAALFSPDYNCLILLLLTAAIIHRARLQDFGRLTEPICPFGSPSSSRSSDAPTSCPLHGSIPNPYAKSSHTRPVSTSRIGLPLPLRLFELIAEAILQDLIPTKTT
jgi:hypothetical protein